MKTSHILSVTALLAAAASPQAASYTYSTTGETNIDWADIVWNPEGTPGVGDNVELQVNNSTAANVYLGGDTAETNLTLAKMVLNNYSRFFLGNSSDQYKTNLTLTDDIQIKASASLYIGPKGTLTLSNNKTLSFSDLTAPATTTDFREIVTADGGTLKGNINLANINGGEVIFKNGATYHRGSGDNPVTLHGTAGRVKLTFDDSTYNGYFDWEGLETGYRWGNNSFYFTFNGGSLTNANDTQVDIVFRNGSVLNGAGVRDGNTVTYYDFSGDATKMTSGTQFNFYINNLYKDTNYLNFEVTGGSKVSGSSFVMGDQGSGNGGYLNTLIKGDSSEKVSHFAIVGGSSLALSNKADIDQTANKFTNTFNVEGHTNILMKGSLGIGANENLGGKGYLNVVGDNNTINTGDINLNAGYNREASIAEIYLSFGKDATATNSSWSFNNFNAYSGGNSKIATVFDGNGGSNSITPRGNFNVHNSQYAGGDSLNRLIFTNGLSFVTGTSMYIETKMSGTASIELTNNADITVSNLDMRNAMDNSTSSAKLIVDSSKFKSTGTIYFANDKAISGETSITVQGNGSEFTANVINMNRSAVAGSEHQNNMTMNGSGNSMTINSINFSDNSTHNNYNIYLKGDSASNKNSFLLANDLVMQGSLNEGTYSANFTVAGNTTFARTEDRGVVLKLNEFTGKVFKSGITRFTVKGSGNEMRFNSVIAGNSSATGGEGIFRVEGSGSKITVENEFKFRAGRDASGKLTSAAGKLELRLDTGGISAINLTGNNYEFTGLMEIDLSGLGRATVDQTGDGFEIFTLMTSPSGNLMSKLGNYWFDFDSGKEKTESVRVITQSSDDEYEFWVDGEDGNYKFNVYYKSAVPEPAAFAAVFGLAALAFATRRRRRN